MLPSRLGPILRSLIRRRRFESEMTEEVRFHIGRRTDDLMSLEGLSRDEALRRARMEFGSPEKYKEEARQSVGVHQLDILVQDIRYGLRGLRRNPNFTAAAVLTLGLGIGATTVVFSVVDSFLLRPAPFDEPERLAQIYRWSNPGTSGPFQPTAVFPLWREQTDLFEQVEADVRRQYVVNMNGSPELLSGDSVTVGMFRFLGVQPVLGRDFAVDESSENVVILSYGTSARLLGAAPASIGRTIRIDGEPHIVVGVMPADFRFPDGQVEFWTPLDLQGAGAPQNVSPIVRLRKGLSLAQADERVSAIARDLDPSLAEGPGNRTARLQGFYRYASGGVLGDFADTENIRRALILVFGAAGLLFLVASANAANLFLSRAVGRQHETAVRAALGGGRTRLLRQTLTEAVLVAAISGVAGLLMAAWIIDGLSSVIPATLVEASMNPLDLDPRAGIWAIVASLIAGFLASTFPALRLIGGDIVGPLKKAFDASFGSDRLRRPYGYRGLLIAVEAGLSTLLLVGAGLIAQSLWTLTKTDTGWSSDGVLVIEPGFITPSMNSRPGGRYSTVQDRYRFMSELRDSVRTIPGVDEAAGATGLPLRSSVLHFGTLESGDSSLSDVLLVGNRIFGGYFDSLGIPIHSGPGLEAPAAFGPDAAVTTREMADRLWPGQDPIGRSFRMAAEDPDAGWMRVVGVVGDVQSERYDFGSSDPLEYYELARPDAGADGPLLRYVVVKTDGRSGIVSIVRERVRELDGGLPVRIQAMAEIYGATLAQPRFHATLFGGFALIALLLACAGVYAVVSYEANGRKAEIGIRVALGATRRDVIRHVMGRSIGYATAGIALGLAGGLILTRLMSSMLFDIRPTDPATFAGASVLLITAVIGAAYLPVRRMVGDDPMRSLRRD